MLPSRLNAQVLNTATLSGTVSDPSGAGVPRAVVTLESVTENASRSTVTDASGAYVIAAIKPSAYRLVVKATGFEEKVLTDISLVADQGSTLNVTLKVGQVTAEVDVSAAPPLLDTTTSAVGGAVTSHQFTNLPMLGRNFTSLIDVLPATAPVPSQDAGYANSGVAGLAVMPAVFGQRQRDSAYSLDGAPDTTPNFTRLGMIPPPEAIQEMKVSSGLDTGAFGWSSGPEITVVSKSGTNRYHGDFWEYVQNDDFNARSFFQPSVGPYKWNQFGGAIGGPLQIPHLLSRDRAWYIFGYFEGIRLHTSSNFTALVPTAAQLAGNFTGFNPIYNPYTTVVDSSGNVASRMPFANNQIPASMLNQPAVSLAKALYPAPNLPPGVNPGANFFSSALNTNVSDQYSVRVDHQFGSKDSFYGRWSDWYYNTTTLSNPIVPSYTHTHYTSGVVGDTHSFSPGFLVSAKFAVIRYMNTQGSAGPGPQEVSSLGLQSVFPPFEGDPSRLYVSGVTPAGYLGLSSGTFGIYGPEYYRYWSVDAQKSLGRHSIWFGGTFTQASFGTDQTNGAVNFSSAQTAFGPNTGDSVASYVLGLPTNANRLGQTFLQVWHYNIPGLYVQDQFRATRSLTVNYGLRWDGRLSPHESPGLGTFDYFTGQYRWDHANIITNTPANVRQGLQAPDYRNFQPRVGIAYQITPKTVVRASYGIYDNIFGTSQQEIVGIGKNWPWAFPQSVTSLNLTTPTTVFPNIYPGPAVGSPTPTGCNTCGNPDYNSSRQPYVEEWTFSLQRQFTMSTMVEAAYFGTHGVKQDATVLMNYALNPGTTPLSSRLPWPNFPTSSMAGWDELSNWYDGMFVQVKKTYSRGFSLLANYTWSKTLNNGGDSVGSGGILGAPGYTPLVANLNEFKGPADFDIRHLFNLSYIYDIPAKTGNRLLDAVIAHWNWSGIFSVSSGVPAYVLLTFDNENTGATGSEFPNIVANPTLSNPTINKWFNTNAYQLPGFGTRGNAGKYPIYSQTEKNWNTSMSKRWLWGESRDVQLRAEFFNILNAHTFDPPGVLFGTGNFGKVSSTARQGGRQLELALKLHF
jgi:hypothetical protein